MTEADMDVPKVIKTKRIRSKRGVHKEKLRSYIVFEVYQTIERKPAELLRKELYNTAVQVAYCCTEFKNDHSVYNTMKKFRRGKNNTNFKLYKAKLPIQIRRPELTAQKLYPAELVGWLPQKVCGKIKLKK